MEAGGIVQRIYPQAVVRNVGTDLIGAFYDEEVIRLLCLEHDNHPLFLVPIGGINKVITSLRKIKGILRKK